MPDTWNLINGLRAAWHNIELLIRASLSLVWLEFTWPHLSILALSTSVRDPVTDCSMSHGQHGLELMFCISNLSGWGYLQAEEVLLDHIKLHLAPQPVNGLSLLEDVSNHCRTLTTGCRRKAFDWLILLLSLHRALVFLALFRRHYQLQTLHKASEITRNLVRPFIWPWLTHAVWTGSFPVV